MDATLHRSRAMRSAGSIYALSGGGRTGERRGGQKRDGGGLNLHGDGVCIDWASFAREAAEEQTNINEQEKISFKTPIILTKNFRIFLKDFLEE